MGKALGLDIAAKRKRTRADYPYHEDYRTRWNDNDMFHHLNNPVYAVLIDSIINSYLMQYAGYSTAKSAHIGLVAHTYCDYFGSAQYPGMLDVGLRVVKLGTSSVMYEVGVFQEGQEEVKAVGGFIQIWVLKATNKVDGKGVPSSVREPIRPLLKGSEQEDEMGKAKL
ncbi:HotDog domain-containing protein [Neohortaea acidophila]|uniref:HotDog domain-containing protein n=1 Tax=Neohortaea acidophila TaxID=245834 RepID=A0A6A6PS47_9PEZI|nr:HotDog domain-containing protein [Neohortaea acidophila]KAF2482929.1 HotDog domain-containing protein [Neohortaea acidophila]